MWFCGNNMFSNDHENSIKTGTAMATQLGADYNYRKINSQYDLYKRIKSTMFGFWNNGK